MAKSTKLKWSLPGSVLNALWGSVMPKLAATVWKGDLTWPPEGVDPVIIHKGGDGEADLLGHPLVGEAQEDFWHALARIAFGSNSNYQALKDQLDSGTLGNGARPSAGQRAAHVVLKYFDPDLDVSGRVPFRVIRTDAYDFVLSAAGLDVFIPKNPFEGSDRAKALTQGQIKVLQMYRFRETGKPPIALPGQPSTFGNGTVLIPIPQLSSPTGSFQIHERWSKGQANLVDWWLAGSSYRGMMAALPRVIATKWYDELVGKSFNAEASGFGPTKDLFETDLAKLLEERMETPLPAKMAIKVGEVPSPEPVGWHAHDVMITNQGFYFPHPGGPPDPNKILDAIEQGTAGNPVFTDSDTDE